MQLNEQSIVTELKPVLELSARDDIVKKWDALSVSVKQLEAKEKKSEIEEKRLKLLATVRKMYICNTVTYK